MIRRTLFALAVLFLQACSDQSEPATQPVADLPPQPAQTQPASSAPVPPVTELSMALLDSMGGVAQLDAITSLTL